MRGWGAYLSSGEFTSGSLNLTDSQEHINYLELKTIFLAVQEFEYLLKNKSILIRCDNTTAVFYVNKLGGTHSKKLCLLSLKIWYLFNQYLIVCICTHITGLENTIAQVYYVSLVI